MTEATFGRTHCRAPRSVCGCVENIKLTEGVGVSHVMMAKRSSCWQPRAGARLGVV